MRPSSQTEPPGPSGAAPGAAGPWRGLGRVAVVTSRAAGPGFAHVIWRNGTDRDKAIARHMIERGWGATMVLTEPDAGSDVGAGRTRALPQPDGSWHIEGVKRFITSAEHDLTENIVHLVLARPVGVDGAGGPGTKGLSLFVVPKLGFDLQTGELTGERNGAFVTGVEHKLGIKASTTCELTFGGVLLGTESLQTLGGSGFLQDYPLEQYVRDAKIDTLYEGTTAIQGLDLFFRKIVRNKGTALAGVAAETTDLLDREAGGGRLKTERALLATALEDAQAMVGAMVGHLMASNPQVEGGDLTNVYKAGLNTTRLMMALGDVVCAYLLVRQADVALAALDGPVSEQDQAFYEGKVASAQFFARTVLPTVTAERAVLESTDLLPMELDEASF